MASVSSISDTRRALARLSPAPQPVRKQKKRHLTKLGGHGEDVGQLTLLEPQNMSHPNLHVVNPPKSGRNSEGGKGGGV